MSAIKDIYSPVFYDTFSFILEKSLPGFDKQAFIGEIFGDTFASMEWKQRMKHTTLILHKFMPENFSESAKVLKKIIVNLRSANIGGGLEYIFLADYIEAYGLDDFETSVDALEFVTQFISCEFAVRPFILKYGNTMINEMVRWSKHENLHVRRFASEGSRPRLPWAMAIPALKKDPTPLFPILENLKDDPSEYVRRSVANNLNDIAKDHPDIVLEFARKWRGTSKQTDAIIKHGCRTLLKQGHAQILETYGLHVNNLEVNALQIITPQVKIGDSLSFGFTLTNGNDTSQIIRLEYGVYYMKANGQLARKVFKISEKEYPAGIKLNVQRKQSFKLITTKKFYTGLHQVSVIVNGKEMAVADFTLVE